MEFRVEYNWIDAISTFRFVVSIVWCLVMGLLGYFSYNGGNVGWASICAFLVIMVLYIIVALVLNKTVLHVTPELVVASHGPLPWFSGFEIKTADICSIIWKESDRHDVALTRGTYTFYFSLADGKRISIFALVPISEYRPALQKVHAIQEWLAPYQKIDIAKASGLRPNIRLRMTE